ncbi:MAG: hypothetical protein IH974_06045 [Myxococcales bacterium]|nr:hypothetical protein [Myxococcales bacterium]
MTNEWCAVAPLLGFDERLTQDFSLGNGVILGPTPAWLREERATRHYGALETLWATGAVTALSTRYEATRVEEPDPDREGFSLQDRADHALELASLALWLARPSQVGIRIILHSPEPRGNGEGELHRVIPIGVHPADDATHAHDEQDLEAAHSLHEAIASLKSGGTTETAILSLLSALQQNAWVPRYAMLWIALEALFGPQDAREMRFRMAQRVALFLERGEEAKTLFDAVKSAYDLRSKVIHGARIAGLTLEQRLKVQKDAEDLARRSVCKILFDPSLPSVFDGKKREIFFDEKVFA